MLHELMRLSLIQKHFDLARMRSRERADQDYWTCGPGPQIWVGLVDNPPDLGRKNSKLKRNQKKKREVISPFLNSHLGHAERAICPNTGFMA